MCGIAGRYNYLTHAPVDPGTLRRMADLLAHRGPDGDGVHADGAIGLSHRRLAVIDLTDAGRQPMSYGGALWITYNGEIYNFQDLRRELESRGHAFQSHTDTEVILAAYREWGASCVDRLHGMFAFAIWDGASRRLFAARDRLGKKPFCYRVDRDGLAFASEPKAFLAEASFRTTPDPVALKHFLALQYVPAPLSAFTGVQHLPPGHTLTVDSQGVRVERYWRLRYGAKLKIDEPEALDELERRLTDATRKRLIADVPLGAFLSGGIDSSLVVAMMASAARRVRTFSIGFREREYSELDYARQVAVRFGTDHQEFTVTPDAAAILPRLVWSYGEPFGDSSAVPTMYLAEVTRRSVTVVLTGDAGDENCAGYDRYLATRLAGWHDRMPRVLTAPLGGILRALPDAPTHRRWTRLKRFAEALPLSPERRYARLLMPFGPALTESLLSADFARETADADPERCLTRWYAESDAADFLDATLDVDVNSYLPDDLLVKVDIATMAHSLEARAPFLDHELMEFFAALPPGLKLKGLTQKYLLRQLARRRLPAEIVDRPKRGFGVPLDHWFRHDLRPMAADLLLSDRFRSRGYFKHATVARLLDEHVRGVRQWHHQLWSLVVFELWHQTFVDQRPSGPPAA